MAAVESEADDKFANIDLESLLSRVGRRPLTFGKLRSLNKAPEFEKRLTGEETVNEGTTIQLETKVSGFPRPILRWFKDEEEIVDHPRIHVESNDNGVFVFTLENVNKGDAAAYRCRAENDEGVSSSMFYLHVKAKPKSPKKSGKHLTKRTVSYPPMFPTIVEKVEEEEKAAKETARSPPSPLTQLYDGLTLQTRHTWPKFLGDWAYVENAHRNGGSLGSETDSETGDGHSLDSIEQDEVFSEDSCEKSSEGDPASFYLSSEDATPGTPECLNGGIKEEISDVSLETESVSNKVVSQTEDVNKTSDNVVETSDEISRIPVNVRSQEQTVTSEPNNNEAKAPRSKKDLHLPLSNGTSVGKFEMKEGKENVQLEKIKKRKEKDSGVKKGEDKKKSSDSKKVPKKVPSDDKEKVEKSVKKTEKEKEKVKKESKEKVVKEGLGTKKTDQKESPSSKKSELKDGSGVKRTDSKDDTKSKSKSKDATKSPPSEKKTSKKSDSKDKKTDSPKRRSESKETKSKCDYINNPDPPILGSARPLVFTNLASKLTSCTSGSESCEKGGDNSHDSTDVYSKTSVFAHDTIQCKDPNGDSVRYQDDMGLALVPTPVGDVPFGRYFEEFIFVVCLFTFLSLCIGVPTETFVLVILGMHFFYSMVTILGLC